jgi:hypothetical protein
VAAAASSIAAIFRQIGAAIQDFSQPVEPKTSTPRPMVGVELWRSQMAAIAKVLSRAFPTTDTEIETLKTIIMFCGVGLVVSLLMATNGLDMSAGFF